MKSVVIKMIFLYKYKFMGNSTTRTSIEDYRTKINNVMNDFGKLKNINKLPKNIVEIDNILDECDQMLNRLHHWANELSNLHVKNDELILSRRFILSRTNDYMGFVHLFRNIILLWKIEFITNRVTTPLQLRDDALARESFA